MSDFIQTKAEAFAEDINNKIAEVMLWIIETTIWLSNIIAEENLAIVKEFNESMAKVPDDEKDLYKDHKPSLLKFNTISDKFSYWFKKLIQHWYSLLHTTLPNWELSISLYKLVWTEKYFIDIEPINIQIKKS